MIAVDEAIRILTDDAAPREPVEVPLARAHGRALAEDVAADRDFPPTDRCAMDGYAAARGRRSSRRRESARRGRGPGGILGCGRIGRAGPGGADRSPARCSRAGADAVVMVERTSASVDGAVVRIEVAVETGAHVRRGGSERGRGERVLEAGTPIHAAEVAALASVGRSRVRVCRPPLVHVLSTGDELVEPDETPAAHQIREQQWPALLVALLGEVGVRARYARIEPATEPRSSTRALDLGLGADVLLVTGGVSVGTYDLVAETLRQAGAETLFHGVAMKPGQPMLAGAARRRRSSWDFRATRCRPHVVFGVSRRAGAAPDDRVSRTGELPRSTPCSSALVVQRPGRETYHLARIEARAGRLEAAPIATTGSGDVLALARASGLLRVPAATSRIDAGATVRVLLWRDVEFR